AIWEDLDLGHSTNNRRLVSASLRLRLCSSLILSTHHKIERRVRTTGTRYPCRSEAGLELQLTDYLSGLLRLNYFDPDARTEGNSYLWITIGQNIARKDRFSLKVTARTRYHVGKDIFENWQVRIYCDISV
ncbi:MAG: hypothetical protein KAT58_09425, partial [candidate division Zixibacteria bacterium]|nr:hypothetical protein [candidate division Zixibacteria bacterium]